MTFAAIALPEANCDLWAVHTSVDIEQDEDLDPVCPEWTEHDAHVCVALTHYYRTRHAAHLDDWICYGIPF
jgi:hypothetical protein